MLKFSSFLKIWVGPENAVSIDEQTDEEDIAEVVREGQIENYVRELGRYIQQQ